jgi:hypothetical protein
MTVALLFLQTFFKAYWKQLLVFAVAITGIVYVYNWTYSRGYNAAWTKHTTLESSRITQEANKTITLQNSTRSVEQRVQKAADAVGEAFNHTKESYLEQNTRIVDSVRSGSVRLRIPAHPVNNDSARSAGTDTPIRADATNTCELSGASSEAILSIAADADAVAMKLNALQEYVQSTQSILNGDSSD